LRIRKTNSVDDLKTKFSLALEGDEESREEVFAFLRSRYVALARRRVPDVAEDAVQDTLAVVHERFSRIGTLEQLIAFTNTVLRNKIGNLYQSRGRTIKRVELDNAQEEVAYHMDGDIEGGEFEVILRRCIDKLGETRTICQKILSCLYQGMDAGEICDTLGITRSRLKVRTFRCRRALKEILATDYGIDV
jgi:RNA polymerase sigma factor (sigma-70 family)